MKSPSILTASHPSGLSVYRTTEPFLLKGDTGSCRHFQQVNDLLEKQGESVITWS
jgi:uracil-DNA glycosylase